MNVREKTTSEKRLIEYVTLEQAATAFAIQTVFSTSDCLDLLHYAIQNGWISPSDVTPVRHGRWIDKGEYAVCTECGGRSGTQYDGVELIPLMTQFCPFCGAIMDGGAE